MSDDSGNPGGLTLVVSAFPDRPDEVGAFFLRLADDPDRIVREIAVDLLSRLLIAQFKDVYERCSEWIRHPSPNVRRAVAVAVKRAARARDPYWAVPMLDLLEPLLTDHDSCVRKGLGPYAIGDGLLRYYPDYTLKRLTRWAKRTDDHTRWNVAMSFSTAVSARHVDQGLPVLRELATDDRRFVRQAVAAAMRNLSRRRPDNVLPELNAWLHNHRKRQVAELVRRYVEIPGEDER